jgi:hypothetical protein
MEIKITPESKQIIITLDVDGTLGACLTETVKDLAELRHRLGDTTDPGEREAIVFTIHGWAESR